MSSIFQTILLKPFLNATVLIYNVIPAHDLGLAIIGLTVLIRIVLSPFSLRSMRSQRAIQQLAPKVKEIQESIKNDKAAQSEAVMKLYKENNVNPFGGCLPLLVQLPILIGLYRAFLTIARTTNLSSYLYSFVQNPGTLHKIFIGLIDVTVKNPYLAILAGVLQFGQIWLSVKAQGQTDSKDAAAAMSRQMLYFFPLMIIVISWSLPAGLTLYWVTTTLFSIGEQVYFIKTR